jgi:hypothetical protein
MARWQGWGAGPAGAGSNPSRWFLAVGLVVAIVMTIVLFRDRKGWQAGVTAAAAVYFALRLFGGLGARKER